MAEPYYDIDINMIELVCLSWQGARTPLPHVRTIFRLIWTFIHAYHDSYLKPDFFFTFFIKKVFKGKNRLHSRKMRKSSELYILATLFSD